MKPLKKCENSNNKTGCVSELEAKWKTPFDYETECLIDNVEHQLYA
jgi:hypothetical protein